MAVAVEVVAAVLVVVVVMVVVVVVASRRRSHLGVIQFTNRQIALTVRSRESRRLDLSRLSRSSRFSLSLSLSRALVWRRESALQTSDLINFREQGLL